MLKELKNKMGFGMDLTPGELKTQENAINFFKNSLVPLIKECMYYEKNKCFCYSQELAFPSGYTLNFLEEGEGFSLELLNHLGGSIIKESFNFFQPIIVTSEGDPRRFQHTGFSIVYSSESIIKYKVSGIPVSEPINLNYTFYKWEDNFIAVLGRSYAESKAVSGENLCSN